MPPGSQLSNFLGLCSGVHPVLPSQATEERPANRLYSALECAGRFPTVPHPSDCVTFHLEEPDDVGSQGPPFFAAMFA
jgi:hypothetical protein